MPSFGAVPRLIRLFRIPPWPALRFAMRATAASSAALAIAYWLGLESPQWAPVTVWVVALPSRGMTISKGFYRLLGTCVGAAMAVLMMSRLAAEPWIFTLALAAWMGFCSALANRVMYFRSYGAVLAGYTTSIVALLVFGHHHEHVAEVAKGRVICVFLGILVATAASALFSKSRSKQELFARLRAANAGSLRLLALICARAPREEKSAIERGLVSEAVAIEELMHYAAAESLQIRLRVARARAAIGALFSTLSWARALDSLLEKRTELTAAVEAPLARVGAAAGEIASSIESGAREPSPEAFASLREELSALAKRLADELPRQRLLRERVDELMKGLEAMAAAFQALLRESAKRAPKARIEHSYEWKLARDAALRSIFGVLIAGAIWLLTGWRIGPLLVMMAAVNCGVFATKPDPAAAMVTLMKACAVAFVCALLTAFALRPFGDSLLMIILAQIPFLLPAGVLIANARTALAGTIFAANYVVFLAPSLPMRFDWTRELDLAVGFFAGAALSWAVFRFVLPARPKGHVEALRAKIVRDLERLARGESTGLAEQWETRTYHRISRLIAISTEHGVGSAGMLEGAMAALHVGREAFAMREAARLRVSEGPRWLPGGWRRAPLGTGHAVISQGLSALEKLSEDPLRAASRLRACAELERAAARAVDAGAGAPSDRLASALDEMADAIATHREFFLIDDRATLGPKRG